MRIALAKQSIHSSGFTLLEAIVAISIMAGFGMTIFAWINTNLVSITKIEQRAFKDQLIRNVSDYMQNIDIMNRPGGKETLADYTIVWESNLVEPVQDGRTKTGSLSEFQLGLYDTSVSIFLENEVIVFFDLRLVGYEKIRDFQNVF